MKTYLTAIILMIACQHTFAQSTDKLFEMFRNEQGADYVKVSPLMMKVAQLFTSDQSTESRFIKGIKSAQVLDLEECDTATKERFKKQAAELELKGYDPCSWQKKTERLSRCCVKAMKRTSGNCSSSHSVKKTAE